jgi:hypothetical protein
MKGPKRPNVRKRFVVAWWVENASRKTAGTKAAVLATGNKKKKERSLARPLTIAITASARVRRS